VKCFTKKRCQGQDLLYTIVLQGLVTSHKKAEIIANSYESASLCVTNSTFETDSTLFAITANKETIHTAIHNAHFSTRRVYRLPIHYHD